MPPISNLRYLTAGLAAWPVLMGIAMIDGIARETKVAPWLGHRPALILSGAIMIVAIYIVAWLLLAWWGRPRSDLYLWLVGEARRHILEGTFTPWKDRMLPRLTQRL